MGIEGITDGESEAGATDGTPVEDSSTPGLMMGDKDGLLVNDCGGEDFVTTTDEVRGAEGCSENDCSAVIFSSEFKGAKWGDTDVEFVSRAAD